MSDNTLVPIVQVGGMKLTETGLVLEELNEQQLRDANGLVMRLRKAIDWCLGDATGYWLKFITAQDKADGIKPRDEKHARQLEMQHITDYADAHEMRRDAVAEHEQVARFFPPSMRRVSLSFQHHAEAYVGCSGELSVAEDWLTMAESNAWTVAELRAHIRKQNAGASRLDEQAPLDINVDRKVSEFELWSAKRMRMINTVTPTEARALLSSMRHTVSLIETLTRRANNE